MSSGVVFNIQHYSVHDGPGIRTIIFFKGCFLRCKWCSNPESQDFLPQISVTKSRCIGYGKCIDKCPQNALQLSKEGKIGLDFERCDNCGKCIEYCNAQALELIGEKKTVGEVMEEIEKDRVFYNNSGGGVTLSGGEVLAQPEFAADILKRCRQKGINTALETSGYGQWNELNMLLPYTDLVLYDIKHTDPDKHKALTGVVNDTILTNLKLMDEKTEVDYILRVPVIPEYNTDNDNITGLLNLIDKLERLEVVHLLPYHKLGIGKYNKIGREYLLKDLEPPEDKMLEYFADKLKSSGVCVQIGG